MDNWTIDEIKNYLENLSQYILDRLNDFEIYLPTHETKIDVDNPANPTVFISFGADCLGEDLKNGDKAILSQFITDIVKDFTSIELPSSDYAYHYSLDMADCLGMEHGRPCVTGPAWPEYKDFCEADTIVLRVWLNVQ